MFRLSEGGTPLAQATGDKVPLAWATGDRVPFVWAKGSRGLSVMQHLLHDLQVVGTNHNSHLRHQRWTWPANRYGAVNRHHLWPQAPKRLPQKWALQLSTTHCCSHSPGNAPALLLPLPNNPGTTYTCLISVTSQSPAARIRLCHLPMVLDVLKGPATRH